jgi:hypothetical protein
MTFIGASFSSELQLCRGCRGWAWNAGYRVPPVPRPASRGIDLDLSDRYRRLAPTNKIWIEIGRRHQPLTDRMVMPKAAFLRSELYAD